MRHKRYFFSGGLLIATVLVPLWALTFSGGAPARRTGAPGERTCNTSSCHNAFPLNSGLGGITLTVPEAVLPGTVVAVGVQVVGGTTRYGFQITAVDSLDAPVGTWMPDGTTEFAGTSRAHVTHRTPSNTGTWTVQWTAPEEALGPVTFYAAGVEADGMNGNQGDQVYTTTATLGVAQDVAQADEPLPAALSGLHTYPNPFQGQLTIVFLSATVQPVTLILYDLQGRTVAEIGRGLYGSGLHRVSWRSDAYPAGTYLLRAQTPRGTYTRLVTKQ